ncbi:LCP family protein [Merismopedia glauca]|uniref:LytR family transcriptional regulator n=1 Tax=Merismopedia glauca CCAP 1448/3 TaxID=1296344 RepID=A0A2T1C1S7_9CYAN|nr:LCP family protein [Merismopedia glauca]PSB02230.1 LytR family transcriptional regulator [Merismopedia glauca CCAP 1448/3]
MKLDVSSPNSLSHIQDNIPPVGVSFADSPVSIGKQTGLSQKPMSGKWLKSVAWWCFWSSAFALTGTVSLLSGVIAGLFAPLPASVVNLPPAKAKIPVIADYHSQYSLARPVNLLVMGIDRVPEAVENSPQVFEGRSDTMVLLRLNPGEKNVKMLSIPRDTRVEFPGLKLAKINQANVDGGVVLAARVVSDTLNGVPIDRYLRISTGAFRELVDKLGGVRVFVPKRMQYEDRTQKLFIDLQPGWQILNGDQAEQFARFRQDEYGDVGRVQRQQALIKALREKLQEPSTIAHIPDLIGVMQKYIDTNLTPPEIFALIGFGLQLKSEQYQMVLLPGRFSLPDEYTASYWIMNPEAKDRIVQQYFSQPGTNLVSNNTRPPTRLSIAIQNASGEAKLPQSLITTLRNKGFRNVRTIKDWSEPIAKTEIIAEQGDTRGAIAVQRVLGFGQVEAASTGELQSDLTIRLGQDGIAAIEQILETEKQEKVKERSLGET